MAVCDLYLQKSNWPTMVCENGQQILLIWEAEVVQTLFRNFLNIKLIYIEFHILLLFFKVIPLQYTIKIDTCAAVKHNNFIIF
jgi:hypothetical protein